MRKLIKDNFPVKLEDIKFKKKEIIERNKKKVSVNDRELKRKKLRKQKKSLEKQNKLKDLTLKNNVLVSEVKKETTLLDDGISIIIPAYKAQDFIEECLDSIENQTYFKNNNNYEILLGIDACEDTLKRVKEIQYKYRNLYVYMMDSNEGPYVTKNTLTSLSKYNNLLFFDADDVMKNIMIKHIFEGINGYDMIRFSTLNFNKNINITTKGYVCHGSFFIKKEKFNVFGGFKPWRCSGDTDFLKRSGWRNTTNNKLINWKVIDNLFYRRIHNNSLTKEKTTSFKSKLRAEYEKLMKIEKHIYVNPKINSFKEIKNHNNIIAGDLNVSIIVTAYRAQDFIEECLDSIENQTYFKNNNNYEILLGIDACEDTLNKILKIKNKYRNLCVYVMDNNKGTYVTSNTLITLCKYNNILRFDSDDIMMPHMIETIMNNTIGYDSVQYKCIKYDNKIGRNLGGNFLAYGSMLYKKWVFEEYGGYKEWECNSDYELYKRVENHININVINELLYKRRIHENNLTVKSDTSLKSPLRRKYYNYISKTNYKIKQKIFTVTNSYVESENLVNLYMASLWRNGHIINSLESLLNNSCLDSIYVVCNNYTNKQFDIVTKKFENKNVVFYRGDNKKGCTERFRLLKYGKQPYIGFVDDDIIYPNNYLEKLIINCNNYNSLVGFHGSILNNLPLVNYYNDRKEVFRFNKNVKEDVEVDIIGAGVCLFKREWFDNYENWYDLAIHPNMDDIYISYFHKTKNIKKYVLKHNEGYIIPKQRNINDNEIYVKYKNNCCFQTKFINEKWYR